MLGQYKIISNAIQSSYEVPKFDNRKSLLAVLSRINNWEFWKNERRKLLGGGCFVIEILSEG